jgi:[2Fe-2S] binding domain
MSGSVRERRPGVWELRPYLGRDPLTGKKRYGSRVVRATGKRDAQAQCDRWAVELADGDESPTAGTFGDLAAQWIAVKQRRWPPNTLQEHRRIVARNLAPLLDVDVAKITTHTLDVLYAELAARGGACTHRPCPPAPCPEHGPRCRRKKCKRPACPHKGACADWAPCDDQPCRHSAPLSAARIHRIHTVVRSALGQAVKWGWIRRNPADHAEPGEILEEEVEPPADVDVVHLLAEAEELAAQLEGTTVVTARGFADSAGPAGHPVLRAFEEHHALQCGFCTPGMVLTAVAILRGHEGPIPPEVVRHELHGNLCRCTGYQNIVDAICAVATDVEATP